MTKEVSVELVGALNPVEVFSKPEGIEDILSRLEREVRAVPTDPTTETGRKEIISLAYKVSRSKTALDQAGKDVQADAKRVVDVVNAGRREIVARLDALRDEVRKPVNDYEAREKARVDDLRVRITEIQSLGIIPECATVPVLTKALAVVEKQRSHDFQEFQSQADFEIARTEQAIRAAITIAEKAEAERIEAERLAAIAAEEERKSIEQERIAREKRIAEEAAEQARIAAEKKAENDRIEAEQAAQEERDKLQREAELAAQREREAAQRLKDERLRAERARIAAEKRAEEDRIAIIERERARVEAERLAEERARKKREADLEHKRGINRAAVAALVEGGLTTEQAETVIKLVASGRVPAVSIAY